MADRGRHSPVTTNTAEVISGIDGHRVPDRYATGHDNPDKMGDAHPRMIEDYYDRYSTDTEPGFKDDC